MVFHGRPSRDCAPCRNRKTRCDLAPAGCGQCRRAKLTCHGYRSPDELVFRDETRKTVQKAAARERAARLPAAPQWSSDMSSRHAFLSLYVGTYSRGFNAPLQSLLADSGPNGHLQICVDAVGLAFMAFQLNRQDLVPLANKQYLRAIQSLGSVVGSSLQANNVAANRSLSNETLQSVLLLDLYEKMSYQYQQLSEYPSLRLSHIQGAFSIIQSRPRGELSNPTMQQLAARTVFALTYSCGAAGIPIPEALVELYHRLGSHVLGSSWTLLGLYFRLINYNVAVQAGKVDPKERLQRGKDFREEISYAQSRIPPSWQPHRIYTSDGTVFNGYYDIYPRHDAPQHFNAHRILRLGVCAGLHKFLPSTEIAEEIAQITREICASVPHIILPTARPQNTFPLSPMQILECSGSLTALYAAARSTQDPAMRAWILQTLIYMADNGVKKAQTVIDIIKYSPEMTAWDVYNIVGTYSVLGYCFT